MNGIERARGGCCGSGWGGVVSSGIIGNDRSMDNPQMNGVDEELQTFVENTNG